MGAPLVSIVIPAYREGEGLAANLKSIVEAARPCGDIELVVVDDGSPDNTWDILQTSVKEIPELVALSLSRNFGKEAAIAAGISKSRGAAIIVMDSDLQHPPELIPDMVGLWRDEGYEVVNAVKRMRENEGPVKAGLTKLYYRLFNSMAGIDLASASDFKLLDRRVAETYTDLPERQVFFRGLVAWVGFKQTSIAFDVQERQGGETNWSLWKLTLLAINSILAFSVVPMHLITALGVVLGVVGTGLGLRTLQLWATGAAVPGFTTVILLQIFIASILMIGLGIIGAYIAKIYDEVKRRPRYLIHREVRRGE